MTHLFATLRKLAVMACLIGVTTTLNQAPAVAASADEMEFINKMSGKWRGRGTIVLANGESVRLTCRITPEPMPKNVGVLIKGRCGSLDFTFRFDSELIYDEKTNIYNGTWLNLATKDQANVLAERDKNGALLLNFFGGSLGDTSSQMTITLAEKTLDLVGKTVENGDLALSLRR